MKYVLLFFVLGLLSMSVHAAGPILVDTEGSGDAVVWQDGIVHFNVESGSDGVLGKLSNQEAAALIRGLFDDWKNVSINGIGTVNLAFSEGEGLESIDLSNFNKHFTYCPSGDACSGEDPPFVSGSARTGESPILFDNDGSMIDAIQGKGASQTILGFAGPRVVERKNGVLYITEGQAMLNGKFIDGISSSSNPEVTITQFKGAIIHELGHFLGLDHTQVNLPSAVKYLNGDTSEKGAIPTMLPILIDGEAQLSLHFDDKVAISTLYPASNYGQSFCRLTGKIFKSDGVTELQGVNVVLKNSMDPLGEATSSVSGALYKGTSKDCDAPAGDFAMTGLTQGKDYLLSIEKISHSFTGGSSLEPCDPPQSGFSAADIAGVFSCATGGGVIGAGTKATTQVVTTKTTTSNETKAGAQDSSGGGCSLVFTKTSGPRGFR